MVDAESLHFCNQFETIFFEQDLTNDLLPLAFAVVKTDKSAWLDGFGSGVGALVTSKGRAPRSIYENAVPFAVEGRALQGRKGYLISREISFFPVLERLLVGDGKNVLIPDLLPDPINPLPIVLEEECWISVVQSPPGSRVPTYPKYEEATGCDFLHVLRKGTVFPEGAAVGLSANFGKDVLRGECHNQI